MKHLALTLKAGQEGHQFLCHHGVRNFWFPIVVRERLVGLAFIQALDGTAGNSATGKTTPDSTRKSSRPERTVRQRRLSAKSLIPSKFKLAARLLQLILHDAQSSAVACLREQDLAQAQQALVELRSVVTRLREQLNHVIPAMGTALPVPQPESRSRQIVHTLLDCIGQHYAQPITLRQCAAKLGLNVSYVSHLFSSAVGVPFKTYLTELRIEKARELLGDPARCISGIACAVGYASENRFRIAFREVTGLSPRSWRETLRMKAPPPVALRGK